jgi:MFS family permease
MYFTVLAATNVGSLLSMSLSGVVAEYGGWPLVFYFFGTVTVVWFIPWLLLAYNSPHHHPRISPQEKRYIISKLAVHQNKVHILIWCGHSFKYCENIL